jgi:hypothetical protein
MFHIIPLGGPRKLFLVTSISLVIVNYDLGIPSLPREIFVSGKDHIFFIGDTPPCVLSQLKKLTSSKKISIS